MIATFQGLLYVAFYTTEAFDEDRTSSLAKTIFPPIEAPGGRRRTLEKAPGDFGTG